jgi:hypothetical protein
MDIVSQLNIGALAVPTSGVRPQSASAGAINGASVDRAARNMPLSCLLHQNVGALGGAPSTTSVVTKLQDSADNSSFADYAPANQNNVVQACAALTATNTDNAVGINLSSARRYIRAVTTVAFTGGTAPTALVAATLVVAGENLVPAI